MTVEWRSVTGFPEYQVSSDGEVRNATTGGLRSLHLGSRGYLIVTLWSSGVGHTVLVHRLVARAFLDEPEDGQQARHLDGVKTHNSATNLAWGSAAENAADKVAHGTARNSHANQTHCKNGHPLSGDNLRVAKRSTGDVRLCVTCRRASSLRYTRRAT